MCSAARYTELADLPEKQTVQPVRGRAGHQAVASDEPEVEVEGEKEDVGDASTEPLPSVVDSLDIRVARKQGESDSEGGGKSSTDEAERFRPNLAVEASLRKARTRKGEARHVARGTQQRNKGKAPASDRSSESDSSDSSESDDKSESSPAVSSDEEEHSKSAGSDSDPSSGKKGRSVKRARIGRPKKQAPDKKIQKESAFGAAIDKGKRSEASLVAPVQRANVQALLNKKAKIATGQSVKGDETSVKGQKGKKRPPPQDGTGSTAKAGGLRGNMYK